MCREGLVQPVDKGSKSEGLDASPWDPSQQSTPQSGADSHHQLLVPVCDQLRKDFLTHRVHFVPSHAAHAVTAG